jgi:phage-related protein
VQSELVHALYVAQLGGIHRKSKPLKGFGGTRVMEIVSDHRGNSYRCIYTVRFSGPIYVLHTFQKKLRLCAESAREDTSMSPSWAKNPRALAVGMQGEDEKMMDFT